MPQADWLITGLEKVPAEDIKALINRIRNFVLKQK
jgi:hypothetical protein